MNTLENKIQSDLILAMKEKNEVKKDALKSIKQIIMETRTAVNGKKDLDDADILKLIQKVIKQKEETAIMYEENGAEDKAKVPRAEIEVLNSYLPKMLSESELIDIVAKVIVDMNASTMKDMGKVMGFINKTYAGQVNGSVVSKIVKSKLS